MNILLIKFRHIGDVLLLAPLVDRLAEQYPDGQIYALVKPGTEAMLQGHAKLTELFISPAQGLGKLEYFRQYWQLILRMRRLKFALAINTTEGDHGLIVSFLIAATKRVCLRKKRENFWRSLICHKFFQDDAQIKHMVLKNLNLIENQSTTTSKINVNLSLSSSAQQSLASKLEEQGYQETRRLVHLHPLSRWLFKCLPVSKIAKYIDYLHIQHNCQVAITAAAESKEMAMANQVLALTKSKPINLLGRLTLAEMAALSARSDLFIGVDSAPMHMAAAVDTPVIALFGPTGAFQWGPWPNGQLNNHEPYPERKGWQNPGKHIVVQMDWPCVPCGQAGCENSRKSRCLNEMDDQLVYRAIDQQLSNALGKNFV